MKNTFPESPDRTAEMHRPDVSVENTLRSSEAFAAPNRKDYIQTQKASHGRKIFGVFPGHYPRELLWAFDILPVEIWDPPIETSRADAHLQSYICPVAKRGLELILDSRARGLDGVLFPHLCDTLQNLASLTAHYLQPDLPVYFFYTPKSTCPAPSWKYYIQQTRGLAERLAERFGPLDPAQWAARSAQALELDRALEALYALRAGGRLVCSNAAFYSFIRQAEYLHPDDFLPRIERFRAVCEGKATGGKRVLLSGILPNPPETLEALDDLGVRVADDDLLDAGRRIPAHAPRSADPWERAAERFFALPPCSTGSSPLKARLERLAAMVRSASAGGVIFWTVKFCEPEAFDLPELRSGLKRLGIPSLVIESALDEGLTGQTATRLEAFLEMLP